MVVAIIAFLSFLALVVAWLILPASASETVAAEVEVAEPTGGEGHAGNRAA
jgi:hypothetical protein